METFVRLTSVLGINLKPNEDIDYADEPFLPMSPMEALRTSNYHTDVPVLIGYNENDGLILTTPLVTDSSLYFLYRSALTNFSKQWLMDENRCLVNVFKILFWKLFVTLLCLQTA